MQRENLQLIFMPRTEKPKIENIDKISVRRIKFYTGISIILLPLILILIGLGVTLILFNKHWNDMKQTEMCKTYNREAQFSVGNKSISYDRIKQRSIFYYLNGEDILTDLQACSIESALKQVPRKTTVYLIQLLCNNNTILTKLNQYKYLLRNYYKNAVFLTKNASEYFINTPLNGLWDCHDDTADLAAMAATAWRFSGIVLTPKLFINDKTLLTPNINNQIYVSPNIFYTPIKCHKFFYQLMNNLLKNKNNLKNKNELIEDNLTMYNSNSREPIKNLTNHICGNFTCPLVFIEELIHENGKFLTEQLFNICPVVMKHLKSTIKHQYKFLK